MIKRRPAGKAASAFAMALLAVFPAALAWRSVPAQETAGCGPSPVGTTCGGSGPASLGNTGGVNLGAGNPINLLTGNKYQREEDMLALPGELGVEIVRHYNSLDRSAGSFGVGWKLSYDTELTVLGNTVQVSEADGHRITFRRPGSDGGICVSTDPAHGTLQIQQSRGGRRYVWTWPNGRTLSFDASGRLQEIADGHGGLLTLTRGLRGELLSVTDPMGRQLTIQYEQEGGRIAAIRSPLGRFTYGYESHGGDPKTAGMTSVIMSDGRTLRRYHYEDRLQAGNPNALTGISVQLVSAGPTAGVTQRLSTYGYEKDGRAIWSMRGDGLETAAVGRSSGLGTRAQPAIAVLINARGERTYHEFAVIGGEYRLLSSTGPGCAHCGPAGVRYEYDGYGRMTEKIEPGLAGAGQRRTEYEYDGQGRLIRLRAPSVVSGKLRTTEYVYQSGKTFAGVPLARIDSGFSSAAPIRRRIDYAYDVRGRLVEEGAVRLRYDAFGRVASRHDADGEVTAFEYDALSRPAKVALADGRIVKYGYDARGRIASLEVSGRVERYEYDAADRLSRVVRPNGEMLEYRYDAADRVAGITDARGNRIVFGRDREGELLWREFHDPQGKLLQRRDDREPDGSASTPSIDLNVDGRPTALRGAPGRYEYDDFGRLTGIQSSAGGWTRFEYDAEDRLAAKLLPNGTRIAYRFDRKARRMEELAAEGTTALQFGANRKPRTLQYPGGREVFDYDAASRLVSHTRELGGRIYETKYRYDRNGQLLEKLLPGGQTLVFSYGRDPASNAGLLTAIRWVDQGRRTTLLSGLNSAEDALNRRSFLLLGRARFQRELDLDGQLRKIGADGYWQQSFPRTPLISADALRLAGASTNPNVVRDVAGNVVRDGRREFEWDSQSRLVGIVDNGRRIASYVYDAAGLRISKTIHGPQGDLTTRFLYEEGKLVAEIDSGGIVRNQYVWLDDQPIAMITDHKVLGLIADQAFEPRIAFDESHLYEVGPLTHLRGSHQYFDAETGLLYNGRRYLDPATSSYLSADPLGLAGGPDPFAFAAGDPTRFVDLRGLQARPVAVQDASVNDWSLQQKLAYVFEDAARQIQDHELAAALRELIRPEAIATTAIIFSTWAASQFTPYGWVADVALTGMGALFLGKAIWDVVATTYQVARGMTSARCESDLHDVALVLSRGLSQAAASLAAVGATGALAGGARIARLLRTIFRRDLPQLRRSATSAAINQQRFGLFNPTRGAYSGRTANQEWAALQRANRRSDAHPPWDPAKSVVDTWLNPGDRVYIIQDRSAGPGGWGTPKQYHSLEEARNELSILQEFKRSGSDLVLQEYTVTAAIPVREGFSGPQVSGWPSSEAYVGGGSQIQFLLDFRGNNWERFLTPTRTIELSQ